LEDKSSQFLVSSLSLHPSSFLPVILSSGLDLCDLTQGNDFAGSLQDAEAWEVQRLELLALEEARKAAEAVEK
jgi:hypothetical protein